MNKFFVVGFFILSWMASTVSAQCDATTCGQYGECVENACVCEPLTGNGIYCDDHWSDDKNWYDVFYSVQVAAAFCYFAAAVASFTMFYQAMKFSKVGWCDKKRWNWMNIVLIEISIASIIRSVYLSIDPRNVHGLIHPTIGSIMTLFTVQLWIIISFQLILFWAELYRTKNFKISPAFLEWCARIMMGIMIVAIIVMMIWTGFDNSNASASLTKYVVAGMTIIFIFITLFYGYKVIRYLKDLENAKDAVSAREDYIRKMTWYMIGIAVIYIFMIIYALARGKVGESNRWLYTLFEFISRILELSQTVVTLFMMNRKRPDSSTRSKEATIVSKDEFSTSMGATATVIPIDEESDSSD